MKLALKNRCRYLARHSGRRAAAGRAVDQAPRPGDFSLQPGTRPYGARESVACSAAALSEKVRRTSVLEHYGLKTLLYGTLLPGPDIGLGCADILRRVRDEGLRPESTPGITCAGRTASQARAPTGPRGKCGAPLRASRRSSASPRGRMAAAGWQTNVYACATGAAARLRLLLRHARDVPVHPRSECRNHGLPAIADHSADAG
jgi:hypothetical protein